MIRLVTSVDGTADQAEVCPATTFAAVRTGISIGSPLARITETANIRLSAVAAA